MARQRVRACALPAAQSSGKHDAAHAGQHGMTRWRIARDNQELKPEFGLSL